MYVNSNVTEYISKTFLTDKLPGFLSKRLKSFIRNNCAPGAYLRKFSDSSKAKIWISKVSQVGDVPHIKISTSI